MGTSGAGHLGRRRKLRPEAPTGSPQGAGQETCFRAEEEPGGSVAAVFHMEAGVGGDGMGFLRPRGKGLAGWLWLVWKLPRGKDAVVGVRGSNRSERPCPPEAPSR